MCLVHLPLSIMQNYPLYFQLISSSQIHILQFKLLRNTVVQFRVQIENERLLSVQMIADLETIKY